MSNPHFKKGTKVEISINEEGFRGVWFLGKVVTPPTRKAKEVLVEYEALLSENGTTPLKEKVDLVQIRPIPPRETCRDFKLDEEVDAFHNDGWWEGVITQVAEDGKYSVFFRATRDQCEFMGSDLRLHREWVQCNWVPPLEEVVHSTEVNDQSDKQDRNFSKGSLVEVSSDEEGFEGAWFAATIIDVLEKDKILVEYNDLTTADESELFREAVDTLHVRPRPPKIEKVDKFKQYDEVDALYNDGWWVGVIDRVLGKSRYKVYFKTTNEEMEFNHDELRLHQDWINGKWVIASQGGGRSTKRCIKRVGLGELKTSAAKVMLLASLEKEALKKIYQNSKHQNEPITRTHLVC